MGTQMFWGDDIDRGPPDIDSDWKQNLIFNGVSPGYPVEVFLSIMEHQMAVKNIQSDQRRLSFASPYIDAAGLGAEVWNDLQKVTTWENFKSTLTAGVKRRENSQIRLQVDLVNDLGKHPFENPQVYSRRLLSLVFLKIFSETSYCLMILSICSYRMLESLLCE